MSMSTVKTKLSAADIMTAEPVCVEPAMGLRELARLFEEHEISGAPVIDQEGRVIGVVSKTDLIRRCSEGVEQVPPAYLFELLSDQRGDDEYSELMPESAVCVLDFMTEDPITVASETSAKTVAQLMAAHHVHRIIVTDGERVPVGIITCLDLVGAFGQ